MSPQVATIVSITGDVSARAADGTIRVLTEGDALYAGEVLITSDGSQVVLDYGNGELVSIAGPQDVLISETQITASVPEPVESEITDPSIDAILAALEGDGDLLDDLEAPAAGTEGAPDGGGGSFVRLMRITETVDPLAFQFEQQADTPFDAPIGDAGPLLAEELVPPSVSPEGGSVNETGGFDSFTQSLGVSFGGLTGTITLSAPGAVWNAAANTLTYGPDSYGGSWQIQVNPDGTYTFEQTGAMEHPEMSDPNDSVPVEVTVTVVSENGLTAESSFIVDIFDDGPSILELNTDVEGLQLNVFDAETLSEEGSTDSVDLSELFSVDVDYGTDGPGSLSWSYALGLVPPDLPPVQLPGGDFNDFPPGFEPIIVLPEGVYSGLSSYDLPIMLTLSEDQQSVVGFIMGEGPETVFTLEIIEGQLVLTQFLPIDHLLNGEPVDQLNLGSLVTLTGSVTVTDRDGDSVSQSTEPLNLGEFITFNDDEPAAELDGAIEAVEGGDEVTGTWSTDPGADSDGASRLLSINGGPADLLVVGEPVDTGVGILTFNADGTWSFVAATNLDHSESDPTLSFQLIKIDGDLDEADATHTITIVDGDGPTPGGEDGVGSSVGLVTTDVDLRDSLVSDDSGLLTFTAGSDDIASFVFGDTSGISVDGLDGTLTWSVNAEGDELIGSLDGVDVLKLTLSGSPVAAGDTGSVTVNVEQLASLPHNADVDELEISGIQVKAIDSDGTESASASVSVTVHDDLPAVEGTDPSGHEVTITNLGSNPNTGYNNSFGYYVVGEDGEPTMGVVLWSNVKLDVNDIRVITGYAPGEIGYFIIPNGATHNPDLGNDTSVVFQSFVNSNGDTVWQAWTADENGDPLEPLAGQNSDMPALFSDGSLHPNGTSHVENNLTEGDLNWEDIYGDDASDYDFNDVNINVTWSDASLTVSENTLDQVASFDFSTYFSAEFGADLQGLPSVYSLGVTQGDGSDSGLIDTQTGEPVLLRMDGEAVQGYVLVDGVETPVFTVTVDSATGVVTLDQLRAVEHPLGGVVGASDVVNIAAGAIDLTKTVYDSDSDTDTATIDIGPVMYFQDAGPDAADFVYDDAVRAGADPVVLATGMEAIQQLLGFDAGPDGLQSISFGAGSQGGLISDVQLLSEDGFIQVQYLEEGVLKTVFLTSGGEKLNYTYDEATQQLIAYKASETADDPVFTIDMSVETDTYTLTVLQPLDGVAQQFSTSALNPTTGGIDGSLELDSPNLNVTFTAVGGSVNFSPQSIGVADQHIEAGESLTAIFDQFLSELVIELSPSSNASFVTWTAINTQTGESFTGTGLTIDAFAPGVVVFDKVVFENSGSGQGNQKYGIKGFSGEYLDSELEYSLPVDVVSKDGDGDVDDASFLITFEPAGPGDLPDLPSILGLTDSDVLVNEAYLENGSGAATGAFPTDSNSFTLVAPAGVQTLLISGLLLSGQAAQSGSQVALSAADLAVLGLPSATPVVVQTPEGNELQLTAYNPVTGEVSYTFVLTGALEHDEGEGTNLLDKADIDLALLDTNGHYAYGTINVTVVDDIPEQFSLSNDLTVAISEVLVGGLNANWSNPVGGSSSLNNTAPGTDDVVRWGSGSNYSNYTFDDNNDLIHSDGVQVNEPFVIGSFTHNNFTIQSGTSISAVDLQLSFNVVIDGVVTPITHTINFKHNETPNTNSQVSHPDNDDIVTILNAGFTTSVTVGARVYNFEVVGFVDKNTGNVVNSVRTTEQASNTFELLAKLSSTDDLPKVEGQVETGFGADGAALINAILWDNGDGAGTAVASGTIAGNYGYLEVAADGTYTYVMSREARDGMLQDENLQETFTYYLTDADGDQVSSTLTINLQAAPNVPVNILESTPGDDTLAGEDGVADIFVWSLGDEGEDTVLNFNPTDGDVLDLADLLVGEESGLITDYISISEINGGSDTVISLTPTGAGGDVSQTITLQGVSFTDLGIDTATMTSDEAIITHLVESGYINIDQ